MAAAARQPLVDGERRRCLPESAGLVEEKFTKMFPSLATFVALCVCLGPPWADAEVQRAGSRKKSLVAAPTLQESAETDFVDRGASLVQSRGTKWRGRWKARSHSLQFALGASSPDEEFSVLEASASESGTRTLSERSKFC